jgi:enoyl-CoA hydratase/carnithine racemase
MRSVYGGGEVAREQSRMKQNYETIRVEDNGGGLTLLMLSRPQVANAMNTQMGRDLLAFFDGVNADPLPYRCIVMTGAGDKAFCAGGDLKERDGMTDETWQAQHLLFERAVRAFIACPVPVIGAINGAAYAGGCELALCCDFLYAAKTARFALTEVTLGIMPGAGGTQNLPRAVGERRAKEIILTGRPFTAQEAYDWGMVNRLCPAEKLLEEALETARRIADNAPISVRQAKHAIHYGLQTDLATGMMFEIEAYNRMVPTEDRREGIASFNEKRKPQFRGR